MFSAPSFYLGSQPVLALYSAGQETGLSLDFGDTISSAVPVYEGHALKESFKASEIGGHFVTDCMMRLMSESGYCCMTDAERKDAQNAKEKFGYVALEPKNVPSKEAFYGDTSDGLGWALDTQRWGAPEALFDPRLVGHTEIGAHQLVHESIKSCPSILSDQMFGNIWISGGCSLFPGIEERLTKEIQALVGDNQSVKVFVPPDRKHAVWKGGALLGRQDYFDKMSILSSDYDEIGLLVASRKNF